MKIAVRMTILWALAIGLAGCGGKPAGDPRTVRGAVPPTDPRAIKEPEPTPVVTESPADPRLPGMGCLVDDKGVRRKVLITKPHVYALANVPSGPATGTKLNFFKPYFLFEIYPDEQKPEFFRVGPTPRKESILGWVSAAQAIPWNTRIGGRYRQSQDGRAVPLLVYADKSDLVDLIERGQSRNEPIARAMGLAKHTWMPWPISESVTHTCNGRQYELVRVNFLGEYHSGGGLADGGNTPGKKQYTAAELADIEAGSRQLDVVFVMDVTGSMQPFIEAAKKAVIDISEKLRRLPSRPDLAFGLVAYRDYDAESEFVTKFFDLETDHDRYLATLNTLTAAEGGDETEAVYDAIFDALTRTTWRGGRHGLSRRVIILTGDCPGHEPGDPQNPRNISAEQLVQLGGAQKKDVHLFALAIGPRDGHPVYEKRWAQFEHLAGASGGACLELADAAGLVDRVKPIVDRQTAKVQLTADVVKKLEEGRSRERIAAQTETDIHEVTEVMEFLAAKGVDVERLAGQGPTFATGWCLTEAAGATVLDKEAYVARAELQALIAQLGDLCAVLAPDFGKRVFVEGFRSRVNPESYFAEYRPEPMDVFLAAKGIPTSQGILRLTRSDIDHMSEDRRAELRARLWKTITPQLLNVSNDDRYFTYVDDQEFGWITESLLP